MSSISQSLRTSGSRPKPGGKSGGSRRASLERPDVGALEFSALGKRGPVTGPEKGECRHEHGS